MDLGELLVQNMVGEIMRRSQTVFSMNTILILVCVIIAAGCISPPASNNHTENVSINVTKIELIAIQ
jgi:hypothetical protein